MAKERLLTGLDGWGSNGWDMEKFLSWLSEAEKDEIYQMLKNEKMSWHKELILNDLKLNHVKVEENVNMMWLEWKKVHIELPSVWEFKGARFDFFVPNEPITGTKFALSKKLTKSSYNLAEVEEFKDPLHYYMHEYKVKSSARDFYDLLWLSGDYFLLYGSDDNKNDICVLDTDSNIVARTDASYIWKWKIILKLSS